MKIGVIQTNTGRDANQNIRELKDLLADCANADLVVTPECTNLMGFDPNRDVATPMDQDPVIEFLRDWARDKKQAICVGSALLANEDGRMVNCQLLFDGLGNLLTSYDKIHMFDVDLANGESFRESQRFVAGHQAKCTEFGASILGHSICFDLRFPQLYRDLASMGANILLVPAAFTALTGRAHWETLLRARAIENGAYVVAPAQCGSFRHDDGSTRHCWGHSMVVNPWGEVLLDLGERPKSAQLEIDFRVVDAVREQIPILKIHSNYRCHK